MLFPDPPQINPEPTHEELLEALRKCSAMQQRVLSAASRLLASLDGSSGISSIETLARLLRPLYADYAAIERKTRLR